MEHYGGEEGEIILSAESSLTQHDVGRRSIYNYLLRITEIFVVVFSHTVPRELLQMWFMGLTS